MDEAELVALERQGWEALSGPDGAAFYREHLLPEALMAFPFGVLDREQALEAMAGPPWSRYELTDARVVQLGRDAAVVVYRVRAVREGRPELEATMSSTWVRDGAAWRLAFHQQSPAG